MTPKEKAKKLILRFDVKHIIKFGESGEISVSMYQYQIKQCAKITVDEVILELSDLPKIPYNERRLDYWQEVKSEIEKL